MNAVEFRFEQETHTYLSPVTGEVYPSITQMLDRTGWIDSRWYTEASSERGTVVHDLTARHDLGVLDLDTVPDQYRGWVGAYANVVSILQPEWVKIEEPAVHPHYRFGGRIDRVMKLRGAYGVLEIKSGIPQRSHPIQTALQAILEAHDLGLAPEAIQRFALYLKPTGRFSLEEHKRLRDFDDARDVISRCCGRAS